MFKNGNLAPFVIKNQQKYSNSELGGTPDTSMRHPSVPRHPGCESLVYRVVHK
jgi:hypothetical protein